MEWNAIEPLSANHTEKMLQDHLLQSAERVLRPSAPNWAVVQEAARSVAVYCRAAALDGIATKDLHVLFSRALWSVGETESAQRLLEWSVESRRIRTTLLALLTARALSPDLWPLAASGAIRFHPHWLALDDGPVWCLDTRCIQGWNTETELARGLAVQRLVKLMAPVWDVSSGRGCLASRCAALPDGTDAERLLVRAWLGKVAVQRRWSHCPRVVDLDLQ